MIRTETSTFIERSPTAVSDYVADFENLPKYERWVISAKKTSSVHQA